MEFEIWHIWLIVAILFFILEIFLPSFVVFNFGVGAIVATLGASIGLSLQWQVFIFSVFTLTSFFVVRPVLKKWAYKRSDNVETNMNALLGKKGIVTETINFTQNSGRVSIDGDDWKARTKNGEVIEKHKTVRVLKVDSIVLEVEEFSRS